MRPDSTDPLKIRRTLAIWSALYALAVWPNLLILYHFYLGLPESVLAKMLAYIGTLAAGPIGVYLWAATRKGQTSD